MRRLINGEHDLSCPYHFPSALELFEKLDQTSEQPDILLLDIGLPDRDGLEILSDIRTQLPAVKVIMLSSSSDREQVYRAICNGASGYILKTADPDDIIDGIRDVIHGASALSGEIASIIMEGFSRHGPVEKIDPLTTRETEVLRLLTKGLIKKEIADQLDISQHTADMHLRAIYRKLDVTSQTEAVSRALRQGLV